MMIKLKYERKGKNIKNLDDDKTEHFKSFNGAKRRSKELQMASGGLGMGSLVVFK